MSSNLLGIGSVGSEVKIVQQQLKKMGLYDGKIDGQFGGRTEDAVKAFQTRFKSIDGKKIDTDGVVGSDTRKALHHADVYSNHMPRPRNDGDSFQDAYDRFAGKGSYVTPRLFP